MQDLRVLARTVWKATAETSDQRSREGSRWA